MLEFYLPVLSARSNVLIVIQLYLYRFEISPEHNVGNQKLSDVNENHFQTFLTLLLLYNHNLPKKYYGF